MGSFHKNTHKRRRVRQRKIAVGLLGIYLSDNWAIGHILVGILGYQTIGHIIDGLLDISSGYRIIGHIIVGLLGIYLSDYWSVGLMGCRDY